MRFRAKFGAQDISLLAAGILIASVLVLQWHRGGSLWLGFFGLWMAIILARLLNPILIYWDIAPEGLRERRVWQSRIILWREIVSVEPWPEEQPNADYLAIYFSRPAPLSSAGRVLANPADRSGFLSLLRTHAPQARFELPDPTTILSRQ